MKFYRDENSARICPICKCTGYLTFRAEAAEWFADSCFLCGHCKNVVSNEELQKAQKIELPTALKANGGAA